jgi:hypothetical protein
VIRELPAASIGGELARPIPPPRRFQVRAPRAVTFWEAIDGVCRATSSWPSIEPPPGPAPTDRAPHVVLGPASADRGFVCNDGPFRIVVTRLFYARDIVLAPPFLPPRDPAGRREPSDRASFAAELVIMAEPRFTIHHVGELKIRQALDDQGHNLVSPSPDRPPVPVEPGVISPDGSSIWLPVTLLYPADPGMLMKMFSGTVSVTVSPRGTGAARTATVVAFDFADVPMP